MFTIWILPFSLVGLFTSWYIYNKKERRHEKLVCFIGNDCDDVVKSKYSRFLGIHLEIWGMIYYLTISVLVLGIYYGLETILSLDAALILFVLSGVAAFISVILVFIQAFIIKEWCEYCLISAAMTFIIFLVEIF